MKHVLFVDPNINGLRAVDRALERGYAVTLLEPAEPSWYPDNDANRRTLSALRWHVRAPASDLVDAALCVHTAHPVDAVIWLFERSMRAAARVASRLGVNAPAEHAVERALDKFAARSALTAAGLNELRFAQVLDMTQCLSALADVGYPAIIKPATGAGSSFCAKVECEADVARFWSGVDDDFAATGHLGESFLQAARAGFLCEQYATGRMVSVELAACSGRTQALMVSGRRRTRNNELVDYRIDMPSGLPAGDEASCASYAEHCARALGLDDGVFHVEVILTRDGPVCVEVNARLMGGYMPLLFNNVSDLNIYDVLLDIHLDRRLPAVPVKPRPGSTVRLEAAADGDFDGMRFRACIERVANGLCMLEMPVATSESVFARRGDVLARLQLVAASCDEREVTLDRLFDEVERESGVCLVR
jgi:biotin carboxylase